MPQLYAVRLDFPSGSTLTHLHNTLDEAREQCTAVMEGEYVGFVSRPTRVTMLVKDGSDYKAVWGRDL